MLDQQAACVKTILLPQLKEKEIRLLRIREMNKKESAFAQEFFNTRVFPVLTPLAVDPGHPFPFLSNLSISYGVLMQHPEREGEELFARIKVPSVFPPWILVSSPGTAESRFISLYELIGKNLGALFPGMNIVDLMMFRVTRNADVEKDEEDAEDLLEMVAEELRERRFARVVRLEHGPRPNPRMRRILMDELELAEDDVYELPLWLEYYSLDPIFELSRPELKYAPLIPVLPAPLADLDANMFDLIRANDLLVHHPYESFTGSVERFIRAAADDPKVIAIKMTLYRTGEDSPFIPLLIRAAEAGKQVACLVELKARFDEERNILAAQALEKAGVHVVYGMVGFKTHCKVTLVVRQESSGVRCYAHIGTGNYHVGTARLYTDLGLFTAKPEFTEDVVLLFHYLTGRALHVTFRKLLVAPVGMKERFLDMIRREVASQRESGRGYIIAKMNSLEDREIIDALYEASQAGVKIELIVRGFCCLRPGVQNLSENIRVQSVIGRLLEHSRIFYFRNGAEDPKAGEFYIGSADWMYRNLNNRVEAIAPIEDPPLKLRCWDILATLLADPREAWDMCSDGSYIQRGDQSVEDSLGTHETLIRMTRERERPKV